MVEHQKLSSYVSSNNNLCLIPPYTFNTFGAVWIPRDYLAGAGRFLGCFHPTAVLKIKLLKKYLLDWPQIFGWDAFSQKEDSSKIWLQKTKHVKSYCTLLNNYWTQISVLPATRTNNFSDVPEQSPAPRFNKY